MQGVFVDNLLEVFYYLKWGCRSGKKRSRSVLGYLSSSSPLGRKRGVSPLAGVEGAAPLAGEISSSSSLGRNRGRAPYQGAKAVNTAKAQKEHPALRIVNKGATKPEITAQQQGRIKTQRRKAVLQHSQERAERTASASEFPSGEAGVRGGVLSGYLNGGCRPHTPRLRRGSSFGAAFSPLVPRSVHSTPKAPPRLCFAHSAPNAPTSLRCTHEAKRKTKLTPARPRAPITSCPPEHTAKPRPPSNKANSTAQVRQNAKKNSLLQDHEPR